MKKIIATTMGVIIATTGFATNYTVSFGRAEDAKGYYISGIKIKGAKDRTGSLDAIKYRTEKLANVWEVVVSSNSTRSTDLASDFISSLVSHDGWSAPSLYASVHDIADDLTCHIPGKLATTADIEMIIGNDNGEQFKCSNLKVAVGYDYDGLSPIYKHYIGVTSHDSNPHIVCPPGYYNQGSITVTCHSMNDVYKDDVRAGFTTAFIADFNLYEVDKDLTDKDTFEPSK